MNFNEKWACQSPGVMINDHPTGKIKQQIDWLYFYDRVLWLLLTLYTLLPIMAANRPGQNDKRPDPIPVYSSPARVSNPQESWLLFSKPSPSDASFVAPLIDMFIPTIQTKRYKNSYIYYFSVSRLYIDLIPQWHNFWRRIPRRLSTNGPPKQHTPATQRQKQINNSTFSILIEICRNTPVQSSSYYNFY